MLSRMMKCFILLIPLLIITGCGGGDAESDGNNNSIKTIAISTQDVVSYTQPKSLKTISLHNWVLAEGGEDVVINDVVPLDENCAISNIKELNFDVYNNSAGICRFKYTVKASSSDYAGVGNGIVQIVSSADYTEGNYLLPISRTVTESGTLSFDSDHLQIPDGFTIESVDLISDISSGDIGKISFTTHSIEYKAPSNTTGTERIFYSVVDHVNNTARPGIIYIAVGQDGNNNPIALDKVFPDQSIVKNNIDYPDGFDIDINPLVSDIDGDDVQLVYASSNIGSAIINGNYIKYKTINSGHENIVYIVSDHNGGYGIGYITFDVDTYASILDENQNFYFTSPMTFDDVNSANGVFSGMSDEKGINGFAGQYPIFTANLAGAYCLSKGGKLPTTEQLKKMHERILEKKPIFQTSYKWHSGTDYLTETGGYNLSSYGGVSPSLSKGYFSCIIQLPEQLTWSFNSAVYPANLNEKVSILIVAKTMTGDKVFLPIKDYQLTANISSIVYDNIRYDGNIPDDILNKVNVSVSTNSVIIKDLSLDSEKINSVVVDVTDPHVTSGKTRIVFGVVKCPSGISFSQAEQLGCVQTLPFNQLLTSGGYGGPIRKLTLPLTDNILKMLISQSEVDKLPGDVYKKGDLSIHILNGSDYTAFSNEWMPIMNKVCERFAKFKIDGRDNWSSSLKTPLVGSAIYQSRFLTQAGGNIAEDWYYWMQDVIGSAESYRRVGFVHEKSLNHFRWERQAPESLAHFSYQTKLHISRIMPSCVSM
ncbi:hypothetical protein ACRTC3_12990 [Photobacterium damselae]|uniref:hypothetical protein n=1 Tax=Photobacterium damselae TaxID=38293 RepID=UPI003D7C817A